jgi:NMD protein affecting ribosome stability and mRNA decay
MADWKSCGDCDAEFKIISTNKEEIDVECCPFCGSSDIGLNEEADVEDDG